MSAGAFLRGRYERKNGDIHPIRVQPETVTAWNPLPAGAITAGSLIRVTGSRRKYGIKARQIAFAWKSGTAPAGYDPDGTIRLPIFTEAAFDLIDLYSEQPYLGGTLIAIGAYPETGR